MAGDRNTQAELLPALVVAESSQFRPSLRARLIDLSGVEILTSLGIGMLVQIAQAMRAHGQRMAVVATTPNKDILERMALASLFPVVETRDAALAALQVG